MIKNIMEKQNNGAKKLYRSSKNRVILGVGGGLGEYFNIDPIIPRIIFLALAVGGGSGILVYILLAILVPKEGSVSAKDSAPDIKGQAKELVSELKEHKGIVANRSVFGIGMILIGVVLLIIGLTPRRFGGDLFWALIIIAIGIFIFTESEKSNMADKKEEAVAAKKEDQK